MHTIPAFGNHLPVKVRFGEGVSGTLPDVLAELGATRVLLMVDEGIERFNPAAAELAGRAGGPDGLTVTRFDKPPAEPTIEMVDDATRALAALGRHRRRRPRAAGRSSTRPRPPGCAPSSACTFAGVPRPRRPPTRTGGGARGHPDQRRHRIGGVGRLGGLGSRGRTQERHRQRQPAGPRYALVDPLLTYSMPPTMTANTGIDALAQAIAAVVAKVRTPIGDAIALEAVRMMTPALVAAYRDGSDAAARSAMSCGSMMAGLAMNISDCTAEHSLGQAIGGVTHVPHGLTIGLVLAETLERERAHVPELLERVADAMGEPDDGIGRRQPGRPGGAADPGRARLPGAVEPRLRRRPTSTTWPIWPWPTTSSPCPPCPGPGPRWWPRSVGPRARVPDRLTGRSASAPRTPYRPPPSSGATTSPCRWA